MKYEDSLLTSLFILSAVMAAIALYVATKLFVFFPGLNYWFVVSGFVLVGLSFPVLIFFERQTESVRVRRIYYASTLFAGILYLFFLTFLVHEAINLVVFLWFGYDLYSVLFGSVLLFTVAVLFLISLYQGNKIVVRNEEVFTDKVEESLRIVHVSDLHIGAINLSDKLERAVDKVNELNPDIICISGDLLDGSGIINEHVLSPLNKFNAKTYFVPGNHEIFFGLEQACALIKEQGVDVLRNEKKSFENIEVVGIDNPEVEGVDEIKHLKKLSKQVDSQKFSILLYHTPVGLDDFRNSSIDLMLSGHTHKGQLYPVEYLVKLYHEFVWGFFKLGDKYLNISSGAGTWGPPMRLGTQNEIVVITVSPKKA